MAQLSVFPKGKVGGGEHHEQIVFALPVDQSDRDQLILNEERQKHRRRAERFGTGYKDPGRVRKDFVLMMEARKERLRASHGFTTGDLDVFSPEEREKRAVRASRFQLETPLAHSLDAYKPDEELEARARRAVKFGVPYQPADAVLMDMDLYEQRREVGKEVERRPNAIYLYGVDVMSTKEVLSYFSDYGPVFVEWLDDSSCNVLFDDANSVKRALVGKGTPLPPEVVATTQTEPPQGDAAGSPVAAPGAAAAAAAAVRYQPELPVPDDLADVANLPYIWHKGQDFVKQGTSVSLLYRMATVADVRNMAQPKRTRELWKGSGGGRGRGPQQRRGKRPFRRGRDGDGPAAMDVDDDGPGAGEDGDDVPMKRPRGARGGQRLVMKEVRPALQPYGGAGLLQAGGAVLPAKGHVLDYTELEDEDPAAAAAAAAAGAGRLTGGRGSGAEGDGGDAGGGDGGQGWRGGRRGDPGGRGRGDGGGSYAIDLREVLNARRPRLHAPARGGHEGGEGGSEGQPGDGAGDGGGGGAGMEERGEEGEYGGDDRVAEMDE